MCPRGDRPCWRFIERRCCGCESRGHHVRLAQSAWRPQRYPDQTRSRASDTDGPSFASGPPAMTHRGATEDASRRCAVARPRQILMLASCWMSGPVPRFQRVARASLLWLRGAVALQGQGCFRISDQHRDWHSYRGQVRPNRADPDRRTGSIRRHRGGEEWQREPHWQ